jgi:hypothetical protein
MAVVVAVEVVMGTPNPLPTSKVQLWDLHNLSRLAMIKVMVMVMVTVTVTDTDSPSITS